MLSRVWPERLSAGFITLSSLNKPQRCVTPTPHPPPPSAAAVFLSLSGIDPLRLALREYCMSRNQWWSNARHAAGAQFIVVALLNTLIYELDIYLPHVQWRVRTHTHTHTGKDGRMILSYPSFQFMGILWWNATVSSEIFVHIMTSNDFLDGVGPGVHRAPWLPTLTSGSCHAAQTAD